MQLSSRITFASLACVGLVAGLIGAYRAADAHCDTLRGPVVSAAKLALAKGDPTQALWWVQPKDEAEVRAAFEKTLMARKSSAAAKAVADRYFYETLVRLHRAGEGEPFTGIKPESVPIEPPIAEAEAALSSRSAEKLANKIAWEVKQQVKRKFAEALERKARAGNSLENGRAYVAAYIDFIHYVEALHSAGEGHDGMHAPEAG